MESRIFLLPVDTPEGMTEVQVSQMVTQTDGKNMRVTLSMEMQGTPAIWQADTTEEAFIRLAKSLPEDWHIRSCISCRFGQFCPVGDADNELFCVKEFEPRSPLDLLPIMQDNFQRKIRRRTLFDTCEDYRVQNGTYRTYGDYFARMTKQSEKANR